MTQILNESKAELVRRLPLYRQLADILREGIRSGGFPDGRLPSERELERIYGVSVAVVKQALILLEQEKLVQRIPRKGTAVTGTAQASFGTAGGQPLVIMLYDRGRSDIVKLGHSLYSSLIDGIREKALNAGYRFRAVQYPQGNELFLRSIGAEQNLGAVMTFFHGHARDVRRHVPASVPVMAIDHCIYLMGDGKRAAGVSYVTCDNVSGAAALASYLRAKGHAKVALVGFDLDNEFPTMVERIDGLRRGGIEPAREPLAGVSSPAWLADAIRSGCTAVLAFNDEHAIKVQNQLHYLGRKIPQEVSLACFDDILPLVAELLPPTTAMAMPCGPMVDCAWDIVAGRVPHGKIHRLPYVLVERDSVLTRAHG
jgi:DNA-binding LacI/PurR family transcriptional regulator